MLLFPIASEPLLPAGNINENSAAFSLTYSTDNILFFEKLKKFNTLHGHTKIQLSEYWNRYSECLRAGRSMGQSSRPNKGTVFLPFTSSKLVLGLTNRQLVLGSKIH
jgi:hypothetical protein